MIFRQKFILFRNRIKEAFSAKNMPSVVALSAAIGLFWNFIPTLGLGPIVTYFTAKVLRGKTAIAVSINLATGFFIPILYTLNIITGKLVIGRNITLDEIEEQIGETLEETADHVENVVQEPSQYFLIDKLQDFTVDFFVGALINGLIISFLLYLLIFVLLKFSRHRKA
ncbi:MAG: DUF2062 domain-containing protein [Bacillota bacterium]|jgi:uncharacterized protein (DUF2062 family)